MDKLRSVQNQHRNSTNSAYPRTSIHHIFAGQVKRTPDTIAVVEGDQQLTYETLDQQSNYVAHSLRQSGILQETLVGLCTNRSIDMVIGILGILKAGGAYVPLDPDYPRERLRHMMTDSELSIVLTQRHVQRRLPKNQAQILILEDLMVRDHQLSHTDLTAIDVSPDSLAYVMYTSGSTGLPKGVAVEHHGVIRLVKETNYASFSPGEVFLQLAPISFDASTLELWGPLLNGGRLVLFPSGPFNLEELEDILQQYAITTLWLTAGLFHQMGEYHLTGLSTVRQLLAGGDVLHPLAVQKFLRALPDCRLINGYGPTENTTFTTCHVMDATAHFTDTVPIGKAISNTQVYVLDEHMQPVPVGASGELYIGGAGLARGYLKRPELTAERFLPHPFSAQPSQRLYRTGDLVRLTPSGMLEFQGRLDRQVKVRGYRIELGEIEAVLLSLPEVRECVVLAQEDKNGDKRLVAYIVSQSKEDTRRDDVRTALAEKLPPYMVPSIFVFLERMPLTANGKVDHQALVIPDNATISPSNDEIPRTHTEQVLAHLWADVLGLDQTIPGTQTTFFELGGHSLQATRVLSRIKAAFHVSCPIHLLFEAPLSEIAAFLDLHQNEVQSETTPALQPILHRDHIPLSFQQEAIWFLTQLNPNNLSYHFTSTIHFTGPLDIALLERCLHEIIQRHEIFRTTILTHTGQPSQHVDASGCVDMPIVDMRHLSLSEKRLCAKQITKQAGQKHFDTAMLPLVRWILLIENTQDITLIHTDHHLVHDGWSFHVFLQELKTLYRAFSQHQPSPLTPLPVQFADFAVWQRTWIRSQEAEKQRLYWQQKLKNAPTLLPLPLDRPRPAVQRFRGTSIRVELSQAQCRALRTLCQREETTLFIAMLTAFLVLLYRYCAAEDICVGTGMVNRRFPEVEGLIGMFVNTVVLRNSLAGNPSLQELLRKVRNVVLEAHEHQEIPFEKVVEALHFERNLSYNTLFQVMFNFHDTPLKDFRFPGLATKLVEGVNNGSAKFDINIVTIPHLEENDNPDIGTPSRGILVIWEYNTDIFDTATIERMIGHYKGLLDILTNDAQQHINTIPLLTSNETQQLLYTWNATQSTYPSDQCIHQLFEEQVAAQPDAIALVCGNTSCTYQELAIRATALAHYLQSQGICSEERIGICMERSLELVICLLGILKAGGAYVPLDARYPQQRLNFMVADAEITTLLTQQRFYETFSQAELKTVPQIICLDTIWSLMDQETSSLPTHKLSSHNLAYVMYTSGSTGTPKGVSVTHRSVVRLVKNTHYTSFSTEEVFLHFAPISFDASTFELWGSLLNGARLVLYPETTASLEALGRTLEEFYITTLWLTAGLFHQMVESQTSSLRTIRQLLAGGDVLSPKHVQKVLHLYPSCTVINGYGPTEGTTFTCCYTVPSHISANLTVPIGRPIANTYVYILDTQLQPVPIGVPGELYIGGDGLARGYLNHPELVAERFIPNPFTKKSRGTRLYRTGDLVRYRINGDIEFLGRLDNQVKIRGYRIEPEEIESILAAHPSIQAAVVEVHHASATDEKQLIAYVVLAHPMSNATREIRQWLRERLPEYMVPTMIIQIDSFPLTPNGKVDRTALPDPASIQRDQGYLYEAPRTLLEQKITNIWIQILGRDRISIRDNFFDLGGHSLLATQIIARLQETLSVSLPLQSIFEAPTIAELATLVEAHQSQGNGITGENDTEALELPVTHVSDIVDQLSQEELETLLTVLTDTGQSDESK